jgi:putative membrane protein
MKGKNRRFASIVIACAFLALIPGGAMAQEANTTKEEVVYASLQANGSFQKAYVVNSFDMAQAGQVLDYGNYDSVTNLTTTDKIDRQGDQIQVGAPAGRFFYQGDLSKVALPWDVSISYTLDGSPVEAKDLAGKSGHLQISLRIKDRADANQVFTKNYMLQSSITLNTEKCSNITAEKATLANSGKNKVITFITMPSSEGDYTVQADVQNFEMQGIQIAGLPLSLGISTPDTADLTSGIGDLQNGISSLDSGADDLSSGAQKLNQGSGDVTKGLQQFQGGLGTLQSGLASLVSGNSGLQGGSQQILDGLKSIQANLSTISDSINQISGGLASLKSSFAQADAGIKAGTGGAVNTLHDANTTAIAQLSAITDPTAQAQVQLAIAALSADDSLISGLKTGINGNGSASNPGLADGMAAISSGMSQLKDGIDKLTANYASFNGGVVQYTNGAKSLYDGYAQLCDGFNKIVQGSAQLSAGASSLAGGTKDFSGGMDELNDKTKNMDSDMQKQIDDMMKTYTGGNFTPVSFVSDKNTNIKSVQFVMMTEEIKIASAAQVQQQAPEQNFWDKLAALFNIKK